MLYHIDWKIVDNQPKLRRFVTDDDGYRLDPVLEDLPVPPYFFAYEDAALRVFPLNVLEPTDLMMNGRRIIKFVAASPRVVPLARDAIGVVETFEADVPYGRRVLIDTGESLAIPTRYVHFDLEVDPSEGFPDANLANKRIISIATKTNTGEERVFCQDDEKALIEEFRDYVTRFSVLCSFNGNHFDWPYLLKRCRRLGIDYPWWENHVHVDLLAVYKFVLLKYQDKNDLATIAKEEKLKAQKRVLDASRLMEYFENDRATLTEYNLDDVRVMYELDQKLLMVNVIFNIAGISHTTVKGLLRLHEKSVKEFNTSVAVDGIILHLSGKRDPRIIWRSKEYSNTTPEEDKARRKKKFEGAHVITPVSGVHKNVAMLDINSLYPTIIQSFNVGPETYREDGSGAIRSPIGRGSFVAEPKSVFSEALEYVLKFKDDYKKRLTSMTPETQEYNAVRATYEAYKVLANSMYGVMGSDFSRYYNKDVAENITLTGQLTLRFLATELERIGYRVILGDTDSVAFILPALSEIVVNQIAVDLTNSAATYLEKASGIRPTLLRLELERLCSSMYVQPSDKREGGAKKRYAAFVVWHGGPTFYLLVKGFQVVRHDSSAAQKEFTRQALLMTLSDVPDGEKLELCERWKRRLYAGDLDDQITIHTGLGKNPDEYKVMTPYLRVGLKLQEEGKLVLRKGDRIAYIKTGPTPEEVRGILPGERLSLTKSEYGYIFDSQFRRIALRFGINTPKERKPKRRGKQTTQKTLVETMP